MLDPSKMWTYWNFAQAVISHMSNRLVHADQIGVYN